MEILFFMKLFAVVLLFLSGVIVFYAISGRVRWYFLAFLVFLAGSLVFFQEVELSTEGIIVDWLKHLFIYFALILFYFGWARFLAFEQQRFDRRDKKQF